MKIGAFAKKNNVSIDTLRHYMEINLLLPLKNGSQYDFDDNCQRDMDEIQDLKTLRFSLKEIRNLIDYFRLSGVTSNDYNKYRSEQLLEKKNLLINEEKEIKHALSAIDLRLQALKNIPTIETCQMGIHIGLMPYLSCPKCGNSPLTLNCHAISSNMVFHGSLDCSCGHSLIIDDGIIIGETYVEDLYETDIDLDDYIEKTGEDIIANIRKSISWFDSTIEDEAFRDSLVMEIGSGSGFFIKSAYSQIEKSRFYIAIDHDISRHRFLKAHIEATGQNLPIQFICCDYRKIPIKESCVDVLVDFTGTSNIAFDTPEFMLDRVDHHLKETCILMASYIIFNKFSVDHFLPLENRGYFKKDLILENLDQHKFTTENLLEGNPHKYGGPFEDYFTEKDQVYKVFLYAKRKSMG